MISIPMKKCLTCLVKQSRGWAELFWCDRIQQDWASVSSQARELKNSGEVVRKGGAPGEVRSPAWAYVHASASVYQFVSGWPHALVWRGMSGGSTKLLLFSKLWSHGFSHLCWSFSKTSSSAASAASYLSTLQRQRQGIRRSRLALTT